MEKLKNHRRLLFLFGGILLVSFFLYLFQFLKTGARTDINLILRRIETPYKAWLNGYLGFFFNVKFVGLVNWMVIPLGILYFRKKSRSLDPPLKATLLALSLTVLLICIKGFFNARYQLTLYPISTMMLLFLLVEFIRDYFREYLTKIILFTGFLLLLNNIMYFTLLKEKTLVKSSEPGQKGFLSRIKKTVYDYRAYSDTAHKQHQNENTIAKALCFFNYLDSCESNRKMPYVVLEVIKKLNPAKKILVNNYPMVYYYTNHKGVYYWSGDDTYFGASGVKPLLKDRNNEQVARYITDSLGCGYILSSQTYNLYNERFNQWLNQYGKPICLDPSDFILYEVQTKPGNYSIEAMKKKMYQYRNNVSDWYYVNDSLQIIFSPPIPR